MINELKLCPFCGSNPYGCTDNPFQKKISGCLIPYVKCCGIEMPVDVWNRRVGYRTRDWVSVENSLPAIPRGAYSMWVVAMTKKGFVFGCEYGAEDGFFDDDRGPHEEGWITHWQYLPNPPYNPEVV